MDAKTIGDSFIIYFRSQKNCISVAYTIKKLFCEKYFWEKKGLKQLKCRIALHNGDLHLLDDYIEGKKAVFGKSITTAARLEPIVRLNEIWCTGSFYEASRDNDIEDIKFEEIGFCEFAKNWGESKVYALYKGDDEKPNKITYEYKENSSSFPDNDFPNMYFIFIRLMNKDSGTHLLETVFKQPNYCIDSTYYIYGDYDVLMRVKSKESIVKKDLDNILSQKKIIRKDSKNETLLFKINTIINFSNSRSKIIRDKSRDKYKFYTLNAKNRYFKAFIYLSSTKIGKDEQDIENFIETILKTLKGKKDFMNMYINNNSLIIEIILETFAYYELSKLVEEIEEYCDREDWDIAKSITFPVHDFAEK